MPSKLKKAIEAVKDQTSISLARVAGNNYSNLEVAVLKATTHDDIPVDERYVYEVVSLVSCNKFYAAACARAIGKRIGRTRNWIVALKSLMLVLRIFQDGDPYFPREVLHAMKRGAKILNLSSFRNDSNSSPWDYTAFVRTFALYLDERLDCFLTGKLQRRYANTEIERGGNRGSSRTSDSVRDMKPAMLLDRIAFWQRLLDRAIATRPTGAAKTNRLIQISLYAVVQESFDLYKDISDGLALLLDSFFHLQYQCCVNAFETCVKATKQFEELTEFYSVCRSIGLGRSSEYPSVQKISGELMETLREFLKDQFSFPSVSKSPNKLALQASQGSNSTRKECNGLISGNSKVSSEFGTPCTSLEELISAAETEIGTSHGISIDLEAYGDQFEKSQRDETFSMSDAVSTHSLPMTNSMVDLVSLDDWPDPVQEKDKKLNQEQHSQQLQSNSATSWELVLAETIQLPSSQPESNSSNTFNAFPEQEQKGQEPNSGQGWELVLAETATQPTQLTLDLNSLYNQPTSIVPNNFNAFPNQVQEQEGRETSSKDSWELMLAETAKQTTQRMPELAFPLDALYHQPTPLSPYSYNPFLDEPNELASPAAASTSASSGAAFPAEDLFSTAPTFQATPTFSAQNQSTWAQENDPFAVAYQNDPFSAAYENDPFAALASRHMFDGSRNQQNLLHEQQLWLQQQNKIIEKQKA